MLIIEPSEQWKNWVRWKVGYVHINNRTVFVYTQTEYDIEHNWHVRERYEELRWELKGMTEEEFREALCS